MTLVDIIVDVRCGYLSVPDALQALQDYGHDPARHADAVEAAANEFALVAFVPEGIPAAGIQFV